MSFPTRASLTAFALALTAACSKTPATADDDTESGTEPSLDDAQAGPEGPACPGYVDSMYSHLGNYVVEFEDLATPHRVNAVTFNGARRPAITGSAANAQGGTDVLIGRLLGEAGDGTFTNIIPGASIQLAEYGVALYRPFSPTDYTFIVKTFDDALPGSPGRVGWLLTDDDYALEARVLIDPSPGAVDYDVHAAVFDITDVSAYVALTAEVDGADVPMVIHLDASGVLVGSIELPAGVTPRALALGPETRPELAVAGSLAGEGYVGRMDLALSSVTSLSFGLGPGAGTFTCVGVDNCGRLILGSVADTGIDTRVRVRAVPEGETEPDWVRTLTTGHNATLEGCLLNGAGELVVVGRLGDPDPNAEPTSYAQRYETDGRQSLDHVGPGDIYTCVGEHQPHELYIGGMRGDVALLTHVDQNI